MLARRHLSSFVPEGVYEEDPRACPAGLSTRYSTQETAGLQIISGYHQLLLIIADYCETIANLVCQQSTLPTRQCLRLVPTHLDICTGRLYSIWFVNTLPSLG